MNRRHAVLALAAIGAAPLSSFAQQPGKVWRVGFLSSQSAVELRTRVDALRAGLRDFGYEENKTFVIESRLADGVIDRLPGLAAELVRLNVDVVVTHATNAIRSAKQANTIIPIVMAAGSDPVALGFVASLARPGGNITGSTFLPREIQAKRIELVKEALPGVTQVAVLTDLNSPTREADLAVMQTTAHALKVTLREFAVRRPEEIDGAFAAMAKQRIGAVTIFDSPAFLPRAKVLTDLAAKERLPLVGGGEIADAGGVIGYGASILHLFRRAAYFVDKIFKGAKPGEIPVEQSTTFELIINLKAAKTFGLRFPQSLLQRADRVIE